MTLGQEAWGALGRKGYEQSLEAAERSVLVQVPLFLPRAGRPHPVWGHCLACCETHCPLCHLQILPEPVPWRPWASTLEFTCGLLQGAAANPAASEGGQQRWHRAWGGAAAEGTNSTPAP